MSTVDAGQATEQQSEPTSEAGCKDEVSRNVQGTVDTTGFAQLRARLLQFQEEAKLKAYEQRFGFAGLEGFHSGKFWAYDEILQAIDAIEADAKDETR